MEVEEGDLPCVCLCVFVRVFQERQKLHERAPWMLAQPHKHTHHAPPIFPPEQGPMVPLDAMSAQKI